MEGVSVRSVGLITLLLSGLIVVFLVGALVSPWFVQSMLFEDKLNGVTNGVTVYEHPFLIYISCSGDWCSEVSDPDPGVNSWSTICEDSGCTAQLALFNVLWVSNCHHV